MACSRDQFRSASLNERSSEIKMQAAAPRAMSPNSLLGRQSPSPPFSPDLPAHDSQRKANLVIRTVRINRRRSSAVNPGVPIGSRLTHSLPILGF
jgi:hypothetical protein